MHDVGGGLLRHSANIVEERVDNEICLYQPSTDDVVVLNATATDIWELIDGATSLAQLTSELATAYGVAHLEIADDVARAVADLLRQGFIDEFSPANR
jgi:hypothetical protein